MHQVYLVDDEPLLLEALREEFPWGDNGFAVIGSSTDPIAAIEEITRLRPDVVFTDLKMPGMDGLSLIHALQSKGLSCEYVMISAYGAFEDTRSFFLQNGFDYILKPISEDDMQILLERLGKRLMEKSPPSPQQTMTPGTKFADLVEYISQNYTQKLTLDRLGRQFGFSPNYICNLFAKCYGVSFTRFVTELRMKEAKRLMSTTTRALKEIAIDCGYLDYWHFFKVFKEYYGVSPTQSREALLQETQE